MRRQCIKISACFTEYNHITNHIKSSHDIWLIITTYIFSIFTNPITFMNKYMLRIFEQYIYYCIWKSHQTIAIHVSLKQKNFQQLIYMIRSHKTITNHMYYIQKIPATYIHSYTWLNYIKQLLNMCIYTHKVFCKHILNYINSYNHKNPTFRYPICEFGS